MPYDAADSFSPCHRAAIGAIQYITIKFSIPYDAAGPKCSCHCAAVGAIRYLTTTTTTRAIPHDAADNLSPCHRTAVGAIRHRTVIIIPYDAADIISRLNIAVRHGKVLYHSVVHVTEKALIIVTVADIDTADGVVLPVEGALEEFGIGTYRCPLIIGLVSVIPAFPIGGFVQSNVLIKFDDLVFKILSAFIHQLRQARQLFGGGDFK